MLFTPESLCPGWVPLVAEFAASAEGQRVSQAVADAQAAGIPVYPPDPLRALRLTPPEAVRVVILGQDPYHGPGQAEGLAFSVAAGVRPPPSLRNIFQELNRDLGRPMPGSGSLVAWAQQGVLLLNTVLTVEADRPASHTGKGWERLTAAILASTLAEARPKVYLLWGAHAQALGGDIAAPHLVLRANHPSPLAARRPPRPFLGCGHFSVANDFLVRQGGAPIF